MLVKVTHKVDTAEKATTLPWTMVYSNYQDAWLHDGVSILAADMINGKRLSLRLDKTSTVFRFELDKKAKEGLNKVLSACSKQ